MKTIFLITVFFAIACICNVSCNSDGKDSEGLTIIKMKGCDDFPTPIKPANVPTTTGLAGTKWKLVGMLDAAACKLRVLNPIECGECYTLEFDTDFTASGLSIGAPLFIDLRRERAGVVTKMYINERPIDGNIFRETFASYKSADGYHTGFSRRTRRSLAVYLRRGEVFII